MALEYVYPPKSKASASHKVAVATHSSNTAQVSYTGTAPSSAVWPPFRVLIRSWTLSLARSIRDGLISVACIDCDRSSATTSADSSRNTGCGSCFNTGPASATMLMLVANRTSNIGSMPDFLPPAVSM